MNSDQIGGIFRAILTAVTGYLAGKGIIGSDLAGAIVTAGVTLSVAVWSSFTNKPKPTE